MLVTLGSGERISLYTLQGVTRSLLLLVQCIRWNIWSWTLNLDPKGHENHHGSTDISFFFQADVALYQYYISLVNPNHPFILSSSTFCTLGHSRLSQPSPGKGRVSSWGNIPVYLRVKPLSTTLVVECRPETVGLDPKPGHTILPPLTCGMTVKCRGWILHVS